MDHAAERRWLPWLVWVGSALLVLSPLRREVMEDDFPLSTYPMFVESRLRAKLHRAYLNPGEGQARRRLDTSAIVGDAQEPMAAVMALMRAASHKRLRAPTCREIAGRLRAAGESPEAEVQLVVESWEPIAYYMAEADALPAPAESRIFARCRVGEGAR